MARDGPTGYQEPKVMYQEVSWTEEEIVVFEVGGWFVSGRKRGKVGCLLNLVVSAPL